MSAEYALIGAVIGGLSAAITYPLMKLITKNEKLISICSAILFIIFFSATKTFLIPYYQAWTFEDKIKKDYPIYNLISVIAPNDFNNYISKVKENIINNGPALNDTLYSSELINSVFNKVLLRATNQRIYNFVIANSEANKKLLKIDPNLVLFREFPNKFSDKVNTQQLAIGDINKIMTTKEAIIRSAMENPQLPLTDTEKNTAATLLAEVMKNLVTKYGSDYVSKTFETPDDPSLNRYTEAEIIIDFYDGLLSQGSENTGIAFKALYLLNKKN